jgi:Sortase and related acyltransferases
LTAEVTASAPCFIALFDRLVREPVHVVCAGMVMPEDAPVALHRKFGFTEVGIFRQYVRKNGPYISSLWIQRLSPRRLH